MDKLYDDNPTVDQLKAGFDALKSLRVSPFDVYAYATALDVVDDAEEQESPIDEVFGMYDQAAWDDARSETENFYQRVEKILDQIIQTGAALK